MIFQLNEFEKNDDKPIQKFSKTKYKTFVMQISKINNNFLISNN